LLPSERTWFAKEKEKCSNVTRELTEAEEDALLENGQFGVQDRESLQRALWWFLSVWLEGLR